jgi:large repetitive protein
VGKTWSYQTTAINGDTLTNNNYRLVVDGINVTAEAYSFRLLDAKVVAANIGLDADVTGLLSSGQETQFYQFTGAQGQRLYLDWLNTTPNTTFWTLYDEAGNIVDDRISGDYETTLANSGRYTIAVRGYNTGAINYGFRLITPETYTSAITLGGNSSQVINGAIGEKGELDVYTFGAEAGQQLLIDKHGFPTGLSLRVYTAIGTEVIVGNGGTDILTISEAGTYRVVINGSSGVTGSYGFRLLDKAQATSIPFNTEIVNDLGINNSTDKIYRFNGSTGQHLFINTNYSNTTNNASMVWAVYGPNGARLSSAGMGADLELDLPSTGEYLVVFRENLASISTASSGYRFMLNSSNLAPISLELGAIATGSISKFGESDTYTFTGQVGQQLYFDGLTGQTNITASLYSPTGVLLKTVGTNADMTGFALTEAGSYKLVIDGSTRTIGDYSFSLLDIATAPMVNLGIEMVGTVANASSTTLYRFSGTNGQKLFFDLAVRLGLTWALYDGDNELINPASQSQDFRITLPSAGTYTLALRGAGEHRFTVIDETPAAVALSGLQVIEDEETGKFTGVITAGQVVEQTFTASSGTRIYFDSRDVDDDNVIVTILNPDGSVVVSTSASKDQGVIQLAQSGTYQVRIQGASATATGDYSFALMNVQTSAPNPLDGIRRLDFDTEITKPLAAFQTHILTFEGRVGQRLLYDGILPDLTTFAAYNVGVRLIDLRGKEVFRLDSPLH